MRTIQLGNTGLMISPLGLGCWQFSQDTGFGGSFFNGLGQAATTEIVSASLENGINWFDTAEIYGNGASERSLAAALHSLGKKPGEVIIADKWWPAFRFADSITKTIDTRLSCLDGYAIDLHQVHQTWSLSTLNLQAEKMASLAESGKIKHIGVSNFSARQMIAFHKVLAKFGLGLSSNQVRYSLLDRHIEKNGVLETAKELGVTIIAYSPLSQGILTGRFHADPASIQKLKLMRRIQPHFRRSNIIRSKPLMTELGRVAAVHKVTAAQVALSWIISFHGDTVAAIPGASSADQARANAGAMKLQLSAEELSSIDELSKQALKL